MGARLYADVVLPLPVDHPFTYEVPESLAERASLGMRAVVPVQNRTETGYIVGFSESTSLETVRPLIDLPDLSPIFSDQMLDLCRWMADYYCCSLGEALQCAVPAGLRVRWKMRYALVEGQLGPGRYTDRQRKVIGALHAQGPLTQAQLAKIVGATALSNTLHSLMARGIAVGEPAAAAGSVSMRTETHVRVMEAAIPGAEDLARLQRTAPRQTAVLLDLLHGEPEQPAAVLYEKHGADWGVVTALVKKGYVERVERECYRSPEFAADARAKTKLELNTEQRAAYEAIVGAMASGKFQPFLLQGVTGSGKTEVYLQAIEYALARGRTAIILVPEISLTPQTVGRFVARFGERVAVLHSGLGRGERYDEWRRAQRGEVRIVVGARSAVFAPLPDLGVIVVDEEHDGSYKQADSPRYHARDVATVRAKLAGAVCVLGSATPSLESYYNSETGKFQRLQLLERATTLPLPEVQLVDMRLEAREQSGQVILSGVLQKEVTARVAAGEQVILLLNRRGFAPFVLCSKCGWVAQCGDCNVSLTYHARGSFLGCHYCNARHEIMQECAECGFSPLLYLGTGTQKVEEYLMGAFAGARIERMDADTTAGKGGHAKILGRFGAGGIDILIGTQMIAKGHDYPGVTLVGVINADTSLSIPDFRAAEQTFQLLTQVAGRAGRGVRPGKVIVQTFRPNHYAVQAAAHHDFAAFFAREIEERRTAAYPPLRRMANLAVESEDVLEAEKAAAALHRIVRDRIRELDFRGVETLGPAPASVYKVKKRYRWNLGVLSKSAKRLNTLLRESRKVFESSGVGSKVDLKVDPDPYGVF
ncbi:MAG TPA: primosomal protein N' [Candidatus Bathyarchaeia archaeon]|nr:primosomal protein N' [Candidatus Bathyarchaeia archaeon]